LESSQFRNPLPRVLGTLQYLILSNNLFSGSLFELVCNASSREWMEVLYIDKNLISGEIPDCWNHWQNLEFLNLGSNNLIGKILSSLGHTKLFVLILQNNSMLGEFPSTLQNFSLTMLDLSENHFNGSVTAWIGDKFSFLKILNLRSNNFDGHIPHKICELLNILILDLALNNISGTIPKCFGKSSSMANRSYLGNCMYKGGGVHLTARLVLKG
ncbi:hypothetical protein V6Z11_D11G349400, partial [Gossypium hirsutum]